LHRLLYLYTIPRWLTELPGGRQVLQPRRWLTSAVSKSSLTQEFIMSARNGDKSRFNRERKRKITRRKRAQELLEHTAKAGKSEDAAVRAQPRSVSV
jgi:hypothetical protein